MIKLMDALQTQMHDLDKYRIENTQLHYEVSYYRNRFLKVRKALEDVHNIYINGGRERMSHADKVILNAIAELTDQPLIL